VGMSFFQGQISLNELRTKINNIKEETTQNMENLRKKE
jgi:hypothetical protein